MRVGLSASRTASRAAAGKPRIEGSRGVPGVPDGLKRVDKATSTGKIERNELGHRTVA